MHVDAGQPAGGAGKRRFVDTPEVARVREWLVSQGLKIDPTCRDSRRKLGWASRDPDGWQDVPGLLELGIPIEETGWTPFMLALVLGRARVDQVASLGPEELKHTDGWSRTPFLLAVAAGEVAIARALVERGSDMEAVGHCGATALHLAAEYDRVEMIRWLDLPVPPALGGDRAMSPRTRSRPWAAGSGGWGSRRLGRHPKGDPRDAPVPARRSRGIVFRRGARFRGE